MQFLPSPIHHAKIRRETFYENVTVGQLKSLFSSYRTQTDQYVFTMYVLRKGMSRCVCVWLTVKYWVLQWIVTFNAKLQESIAPSTKFKEFTLCIPPSLPVSLYLSMCLAYFRPFKVKFKRYARDRVYLQFTTHFSIRQEMYCRLSIVRCWPNSVQFSYPARDSETLTGMPGTMTRTSSVQLYLTIMTQSVRFPAVPWSFRLTINSLHSPYLLIREVYLSEMPLRA